jgi:hypothetical protein
VLAIARHYGRLRYGPKVSRAEIEVLERAVRSLAV